jgi:hypothetical protein
MACSTQKTACQLLAEAESAYHALMTGQALVEITDQNGDRVKFAQARKSDLYTYIQNLRSQCPDTVNTTIVVTGPAGFYF